MWVIDRFEGKQAVIECQGKTFNIPKKSLPARAKAGDVLKVIIDEEGTARQQEEVDKLKKDLFE